ncbi:MFS transporter, partial [Pseudoalteromonas sp. SG41-5]|nr:MFS transporter [Pseudoalteromonas sp. SG41-5]
PLSSALANLRVADEERVGVSSALLVVFGAGAALGSTANAQVMTYFGHQALYASIALLTVIMYLLLTYINSKQKVEQPESSDYVVGTSDVTNSPLAATMDPRIEETTAHEQMLVVDEIDDEYEENNAVFDTEDPQGDLFKDFQTQNETAELKD